MTTEEKILYVRNVGDFLEKNEMGEYVDSDAVISAFLTRAENEIMNRAYPYGYDDEMDFPKKYDILSCDIAIFLLNKRGAEGEIDHNENGINRSYMSADIPYDLFRTVVPFCSTIGDAT